jgi:hypothetical protein
MTLPPGNAHDGAFRHVPLEDMWFIENTLVYTGPRLYLYDGTPGKSEWNLAFYDEVSGEVYAKRICSNYQLPWRYESGFYPWILCFAEDVFQTPAGVFQFYLQYITELINEPTSYSKYHARYPLCLGPYSRSKDSPDGGYRDRENLLNQNSA